MIIKENDGTRFTPSRQQAALVAAWARRSAEGDRDAERDVLEMLGILERGESTCASS